MSMVVDTCVILDILQGDPTFGVASAEVIASTIRLTSSNVFSAPNEMRITPFA